MKKQIITKFLIHIKSIFFTKKHYDHRQKMMRYCLNITPNKLCTEYKTKGASNEANQAPYFLRWNSQNDVDNFALKSLQAQQIYDDSRNRSIYP